MRAAHGLFDMHLASLPEHPGTVGRHSSTHRPWCRHGQG